MQHEELIAAGGEMSDTEACAVLLNNLSQFYQPFAFGFQAVNQSNWSVDDLCNQLERLPTPPKASLSFTIALPNIIGSLLAQKNHSSATTAARLHSRVFTLYTETLS